MFKFRTYDHIEEDLPRLPTRLLAFFWYFLRQVKAQFILLMALFMVSHTLVSVVPYFIKLLVDGLEKAQENPAAMMDILFWPVVSFCVLILIVQKLCAQGACYVQARTMSVLASIMRRQIALYMHHHSYGYYQNDFAGRLAGKVVETPAAMVECLFTLAGPIWFAVISFTVSVWLYATVDPVFGLIALGAMGAYAGVMAWFVPRLQKLSADAAEERSVVRGRFVDILSNILTVKLFARRSHEDRYFMSSLKRTADAYTKSDLKLWNLWVTLEFWTSTFWFITLCATLAGWQKGTVTLAEAAMILPLTLQVTNISWWMSDILTNTFKRLGEISEGIESIVQAHDIVDGPAAKPLAVTKGEISFRDVRFAYGERVLFDKLSFDIEGGQKIGLVGPSGAGKSTLVQVLLRLHDIQGGDIRIDGQSIATVQQDSLREHISVIPQMADLLHRSIRDNIMYGRLDASEAEMVEAAKKARAHEFIETLTDQYGNKGYDAVVGERGVKLSGGQRQRIAIARAVLKDAPILILDEATSALDSESERAIQDSLSGLMEGRTVIAIAHRLSTIAHLDRLLVMESGRIIEDGTHDTLVTQADGHYARLWAMQSGGFIGRAQDRAAG